MKNEKFEAMETQVNTWIGQKDAKQQKLQTELEEAQQGLDIATADSDKHMKAGDLKKYTEAETRKSYYNKRINHITNQINDMLMNGFLDKKGFKALVAEVNAEQNRLLKEQREKLEELYNAINDVVMETTAQLREGNAVISAASTNLLDVEHADNPYLGKINNDNAVAIAENFWYSLQMGTVPHHMNNPRYSKFVGGVPFVN